MHRADKAALRLSLGMGLSIFITYGLGLPQPHLSCLIVSILLCKPGPPIAPMKGVMIGIALMALMGTGLLMVPLLQHYSGSAILLTALLLFGLFYLGLKNGNPLLMLLVATLSLIPVAGMISQALAFMVIQALAVGIVLGAFIGTISHNLFPDDTPPLPKLPHLSPDNAGWVALRAVIIVLPMQLMALQDPSHYLGAMMKLIALSQQACTTQARNAGKELVGSTLMGALLAALAWFGLSLQPTLWMLALWIMLICLWIGRRLFQIVPSRLSASFWSNTLMTVLILLGPAIQDSDSGKDVIQGSLFRLTLFILVSCYAWAAIWLLERWRTKRQHARLGPVLNTP